MQLDKMSSFHYLPNAIQREKLGNTTFCANYLSRSECICRSPAQLFIWEWWEYAYEEKGGKLSFSNSRAYCIGLLAAAKTWLFGFSPCTFSISHCLLWVWIWKHGCQWECLLCAYLHSPPREIPKGLFAFTWPFHQQDFPPTLLRNVNSLLENVDCKHML